MATAQMMKPPPPTAKPIQSVEPVLFTKAVPKFQPPRIALIAVEGWGKTSCAAHAPQCAIIQAAGETGYDTLLGAGLVPEILSTTADTWDGTLALLDHYIHSDEVPFKTLALDAIGGFEKLCHSFVCENEYSGEWGDKGFGAYQKGYDLAANEWIKLLAKLDALRTTKRVMILLLGHVAIKNFKNPTGPDFDRYICDTHQKTWALTHKWCDAVLFGNFFNVIDEDKRTKRTRGIGGTDRIIHTERRDAWDAKNRYNMPVEIDIPNDPTKSWETIWDHIVPKNK